MIYSSDVELEESKRNGVHDFFGPPSKAFRFISR